MTDDLLDMVVPNQHEKKMFDEKKYIAKMVLVVLYN